MGFDLNVLGRDMEQSHTIKDDSRDLLLLYLLRRYELTETLKKETKATESSAMRIVELFMFSLNSR